jgi:hypothetical protein
MSTSRKPLKPDDFSSEWRRQKNQKQDGMPEATAGTLCALVDRLSVQWGLGSVITAPSRGSYR